MGSLIGFIGYSFLWTVISAILGGIPYIILGSMLESAGDGSYMCALIFLFAVIIIILEFLLDVVLDVTIDLNLKNIWKKLKSLIKKEKVENNSHKQKKKKNKNLSINTIELIVFVVCIIFAIFIKPYHSIVFPLIYKNVIVRILAVLFIPVFIMNCINTIKDKDFDFGGIFGIFIVSLILGVIVVVPSLAVTNMMKEEYGYIKNTVHSWFIYDNTEYDKQREREKIKDEYEYFNTKFSSILDSLYGQYDINNEQSYNQLISSFYMTVKNDFSTIGYSIVNSVSQDKDTALLQIKDKKRKTSKIYKLNFKTKEFTKSNKEEYLSVLNSKK